MHIGGGGGDIAQYPKCSQFVLRHYKKCCICKSLYGVVFGMQVCYINKSMQTADQSVINGYLAVYVREFFNPAVGLHIC